MSDKTKKVKSEDEGVETPGDVIKTPPVVTPPVSTPPIEKGGVKPTKDIVAETKAILENSPHVNFIVPLAEGEAPGAEEPVTTNGYKMTVKKGVMVSIPIQIATRLADKYKIAMEAGRDKRIDRSSDVSDALS